MKKKVVFLLICFLASTFLFAQEFDPFEEETNVNAVEKIEEKGKLYILNIEYTPAYDEARFIYTCPTSIFDQTVAVEILKTRIELFKQDHNYFSHIYLRKDVTKYNNEKNLAIYTSFVRFEK